MPEVSIWMLRCSLIWLLVAVLSGSFILLEKSFQFEPMVWQLIPLHIEAAMIGWMVQFVLGVAYWMFPRYQSVSARGSKRIGWLLVLSINGSTGMAVISGATPDVLLGGRALLVISILLFLALIWRRVVSYRKV